jgi:hypothetical protein
VTNEFTPILAAGGNSRLARSARAKLQWRDRFGRWIEMGRGIKFKVRRANGRVVNINGVFVGATDTENFGQVYVSNDPSGLPDGFYQVAGNNAQEILASLDPEMLRSRGIEVGQDVDGNSVGERAAEEIQNESEIVRLDAPLGWSRDENVSNRYVTEDGELELIDEGDNRFMVNRLDDSAPAEEAFSWADALAVADRLDAEAQGEPVAARQRNDMLPEPANANGEQEYPNLLERVRARGGLTLDTETGNLADEGYLVGIDGFEKNISAAEFYSPEGLEALADYIFDNKDQLGGEGGKRLGVWHDRDGGRVYFDVVEQVADLDEAMQKGRDGKQLAIYDMVNDREIRLDDQSNEQREDDGNSAPIESEGDDAGAGAPVVDADSPADGGSGEPGRELDALGEPIPGDRAGLERRLGTLERQIDRWNPERPGPDFEDIEAARDDIQARLDNFDDSAPAPAPAPAPESTPEPEVTPAPEPEPVDAPEPVEEQPEVTPAPEVSEAPEAAPEPVERDPQDIFDEIMEGWPQFTPQAPEQVEAEVSAGRQRAIDAITPYDPDGTVADMIRNGASADEVLAELEKNRTWAFEQLEAQLGPFKELPRDDERAFWDAANEKRNAVRNMDAPEPAPQPEVDDFDPNAEIRAEADEELQNLIDDQAREARAASEKELRDFLDNLKPGQVLTREDLDKLPPGSVVEATGGASGTKHGRNVRRAVKDYRGGFNNEGQLVPEDGVSSADAARQLMPFLPGARIDNGEEVVFVSKPARANDPAPAPEPVVVEGQISRERLPNGTRVSPEGSDKVYTKTGPNSFVDEENKPARLDGTPLVVVPELTTEEEFGGMPEIPAAPAYVVGVFDADKQHMLAVARGRLNDEDLNNLEARLEQPMSIEAYENFLAWLEQQPELPNQKTRPRNSEIPALPGNKEMQQRRLLPGEEEDLNLVIDDVLANFPAARRLANGDIVIASREVNGRQFDVVVRRTPDERFFVYRRVVMPDGSILAAKVDGEAHSYKALTGKMSTGIQWIFARDPFRAITRMKNREVLGSEDAVFQADADSAAINEAASGTELRNVINDIVKHLAKEARNGRNVIDVLKRSFPDGAQARAAKRGVIDGQLEAARELPGDRGPTHIPYGGGAPIKPGDTVQWTDWREDSPTYGQVFEGRVRRLKESEPVLMPNGTYEYTDYVDVILPEYNRLKGDPKPESRARPIVSSNLRVVTAGAPREPFFAKKEEKRDKQRKVAQAGDFNLPAAPADRPARSIPRDIPEPARPIQVEEVNAVQMVKDTDIVAPPGAFSFVEDAFNAELINISAAELREGDLMIVKNDSGLDVYTRVEFVNVLPNGDVKLATLVDDFDGYKRKDVTLPGMFPMALQVFRPKPKPAGDYEKKRIRDLVRLKGPDNGVISQDELDARFADLNIDEARQLIVELNARPEWVPDESVSIDEILKYMGAKDTDRDEIRAKLSNFDLPEDTPVARVLTSDQLAMKQVADRFQTLNTISVTSLRVGDIIQSAASKRIQIISVNKKTQRGQLSAVGINTATGEVNTFDFTVNYTDLDRSPSLRRVMRIKDNFAEWYGLETPNRPNNLVNAPLDPGYVDDSWVAEYAARAGALETALNEGWDVKRNIDAGAQNGGVQFVQPKAEYNDPAFSPEDGAIFVKYAASKDTRDAEYLGAATIAAFGGEGLNVGLRDDESIVVMNRIDGVTAYEYALNADIDDDREMGESAIKYLLDTGGEAVRDQVRAIGLFDMVSGNGDRHMNNWMVRADEVPVPIDNGLAAQFDMNAYSPFARALFSNAGRVISYNEPPRNPLYTKAELIGVRQRLAALQETFAKLGRNTWHMKLIRNMDTLIGTYTDEV